MYVIILRSNQISNSVLCAGAIVGLAALGHTTIRLLLLPQLQPYVERLQPLLEPPQLDGFQYDDQGVSQLVSQKMMAPGAVL